MTIGAFLHPFAPVDRSRDDFVTIVGGRGAHLFDSEGRRYLDLMGGLWFNNVGYGRAEIADAMARAAKEFGNFHCFDRFTNEAAEELSERIVGLGPDPDARVFLTGSGSEAVDSAIKISRLAHYRAGRPERTIVVFRARAYHGVALGGTSASGLPLNREGFGPLGADFAEVEADDAADLRRVLGENRGRVAAVMAEPVQGAAGVFPPPDGYLAEARRLCDEHGAHLIFDEVITGFGRLGSWFASQHYGVRPDLTTFAKAVTSGYIPLGGVIVGPEVLDSLTSEPGAMLRTGHTYSGHHVAAAAALANLDVIESEGLLGRAAELEDLLGRSLRRLVVEGLLTGARGAGAMWAAQLPGQLDAPSVRDELERRGVIVRPIGDSVCFCPPLVVSDADVVTAVDQLADAVASAAG